MLVVTENWRRQYAGASMGLLVVENAQCLGRSEALEQQRRQVEKELREAFGSKEELDASAVLAAYSQYYKQFKKTYHVRQQLESVIFKGKSIPSVTPLVEAMFMAELKNGLLTAGHDLEQVQGLLTLDAASADESYVLLNGKEQALKAQDMFLRDDVSVLSSIIYGPDQRTRIRPETKNAVFTVYAPEGVSRKNVEQHLEDIYSYVRLAAPQALRREQKVYG
ncbi:phenylalanine--tRNA ligase beta subunit-related protein [Anaeromusa sp.]|uniref:phenylalanine--tRNA ligase beta subunit-related protein n=1 Tax=Anaeromusa sp. TaxID=1872520 RepID=UPI00261903B7|nr:phenylalanine--tRNA ligase beta subunit-related protein [Anaeromusa sp.]MDD3158115.1 phenylalanine--tRNA ligase beta subunit-related protein [Anaeromusa sp.]